MGLLNKNKEKKISKSYKALRNLILSLRPYEFTVDSNAHPVVAALVDMDMGDVIISLACAADGTTSLYYSTGGGQIGLGHKYENIKKAALEFLYYSGRLIDTLPKASRYPLPKNKKHCIYLVTENKVIWSALDMDSIDSYPEEIKLLIYYYQNIIKTIGDVRNLA